jgi:hypothetical protein
VISRHGLYCELYTDRGSHYFYTAKAGEKVSKTVLPQVGRTPRELDIRHIGASPEARGRSERMFGTLQDRLVKELSDAGIATIEAANRFIAETYCRRTIAPSWSSRQSPGRHLCRGGPAPISTMFCASRRSASSITTTRSASSGSSSSSNLPAASPFCQGDGQGPALCRCLDRRLLRAALHRAIRPRRKGTYHPYPRRVTRFHDGGFDRGACPLIKTRTKRTNDLLRKPVNLTCHRQCLNSDCPRSEYTL